MFFLTFAPFCGTILCRVELRAAHWAIPRMVNELAIRTLLRDLSMPSDAPNFLRGLRNPPPGKGGRGWGGSKNNSALGRGRVASRRLGGQVVGTRTGSDFGVGGALGGASDGGVGGFGTGVDCVGMDGVGARSTNLVHLICGPGGPVSTVIVCTVASAGWSSAATNSSHGKRLRSVGANRDDKVVARLAPADDLVAVGESGGAQGWLRRCR